MPKNNGRKRKAERRLDAEKRALTYSILHTPMRALSKTEEIAPAVEKS